MCGFVGLVRSRTRSHANLLDEIRKMNQTLMHRGPDGESMWVDENIGLAMGHRRLSIIDLSSSGTQPMTSSCGRFVIAYNGEIYNHKALRKELEHEGIAHGWKGHSDTEVLLAAIAKWGIENTVSKIIGMFAFSLWDRSTKELFLVRDRVGEKPLYYGWIDDSFRYGSELKSIIAGMTHKPGISTQALSLYFKYMYVPAPLSIFENIYKLLPGHILRVNDFDNMKKTGHVPEPYPYWSMYAVAEAGQEHPFIGSEKEAVAKLEELLIDSVRNQMVADVPLGAFLSGGIDSSTIVSLMQSNSSSPVKTFTVGFNEKHFQEAPYAAAVAKHLGTDHVEITATSNDALNSLPQISGIFDEPFADPSHIPTYIIAKLTRKHVKVCLSGDGGDEFFGGYNNYFNASNIWEKIGWAPIGIRKVGEEVISKSESVRLSNTFCMATSLAQFQPDILNRKIRKISRIISSTSDYDLFHNLITSPIDVSAILVSRQNGRHPSYLHKPEFLDFKQWMMFVDSTNYLPDDILVKVDRASMGVSLETRIPLLDHRIIEFAFSLPLGMKISGKKGKQILRKILSQYVPSEMIERPKMGFAVPVSEWIRNPLRDWCESLISKDKIIEDGILEYEPIYKMWKQHLGAKQDWSNVLWSVFMFQSWKELFYK